jgi:hypothetical protein
MLPIPWIDGTSDRSRMLVRPIPRKRTTSRHYLYVSETAESMSFGTCDGSGSLPTGKSGNVAADRF